jgi:two-component system, NtrC family, sensor kinase
LIKSPDGVKKRNKRELSAAPQAALDLWLEERLAVSLWNEALSVISTGLAHDTNNCLTGILSMSDACLAQLDASHPLCENLILAKESAQKATQLIQLLMRVHHEKVGKRAYEDLNRLTSETVELLKKVLRRQIESSLQLENASLPLYVDAIELRRIIILLALNAAQEMQGKGKIIFRTCAHQETIVLEQFHGRMPRAPSVSLRIAHDAATSIVAGGSSPFDPFAEHQSERRDSAMRLRLAKQFVEKHEGAISVETKEGEGAAVELWLPQADFTEGEND